MVRPETRARLAGVVLTVVMALVSTVATAVPVAAHPHGDSADEYTFTGGGWGHGAGMSQYGALGRAEAGFSHQEILAFYYDETTLTTDPGLVPDDVDVRVAVHTRTVFKPTGILTVAMDGRFLDTTRNTLTIRRGDGGWHINSSNIDWCRGFCRGTRLTVSFTEGETVRVSATTNGTQLYAYGQFQLTPASTGADNCGNSTRNQYCLVIGEMTMQQYLYGIAEVPQDWPEEALKAQVIAARSYAVAQIRDRAASAAPFDVYTSVQDQDYRAWDHELQTLPERHWQRAVDATNDTVMVHHVSTESELAEPESVVEVITALYSSSNGGHTAANEEPNRKELPYLQAKPDPYDAAVDAQGIPQNPFHIWQRTYTASQISQWLTDYPLADLDVGELEEIYITNEGVSGRIDDALVTLVGSKRAIQVRDDEGNPYGYRFYFALVRGCRETPDCEPLRSTKLELSDAHNEDGHNRYTLPFVDVDFNAAYTEAVAWMLNNEITFGTSPSTFSPDKPITRAQFATLLWRFAGKPQGSANSNGSQLFDDVEAGSYYDQAVGWLADQDITTGCKTDDNADMLFCPNAATTMPQLMTLLWRFAGRKPSEVSIPFLDVKVNDYFLEPARWVIEYDLWLDANLAPSDGSPVDLGRRALASRGLVAAYLWLLAGSPEAFADDMPLPPLMRNQ